MINELHVEINLAISQDVMLYLRYIFYSKWQGKILFNADESGCEL